MKSDFDLFAAHPFLHINIYGILKIILNEVIQNPFAVHVLS